MGSLTTPGWQPKETRPNCHSKKPRSRGVVTLQVTEPLATSLRGLWVSGHTFWGNGGQQRKGHHVISVRRHLTKNWPALPQKSSENPYTTLVVERERVPKDPAAHKGRGPKKPRCARTERRRGAFGLLQSCCGNCWYTSRIVVVTVLPTDGKQSSRLGLATLTQDASIAASSRLRAVGVTAPLRFYNGFRCRAGAQTLKKRHRLIPYCPLFSTYCVYFQATHFIASLRSPGIGRLTETVKHLSGSPLPLGMRLHTGLTVYFNLFLQRSTIYTFFLEYMAVGTSVNVSALVSSGIEGIRPDVCRWLGLQLAARRFSDMLSLLPCTVTANGAAGHNRGEVAGDAVSRQDTRQDRRLYFKVL